MAKGKSQDDTAFKAAYAALNAAQKEAVDSTEGPVMVIAGPGTGKTQILALRIANILKKTDSRPENVLTLTFTDAGSHAMRDRLRRYIGDAAYHVGVHTFHSFAGELIKRYPDSYPSIIGGRPINDIEHLDILEEIINSGQFPLLRPTGDPLYYIKKLPGAIADLKKENITPDELSSRLATLEEQLKEEPQYHEKGAHKGKVRGAYAAAEKRLNKLRELLNVYKLYQAALKERHLFDFEDMILETVKALENNEDMLLDLQETYHYLLADEHQDVNQAQNKILELLADYHEQPNIFVVGDEKQAIYRFQGASLENFLFFQNRFPDTKVISLTDNYRSSQSILDITHDMIRTDDTELSKLRVPLTAAGQKEKSRQERRLFSHQGIEDEWIVKEIENTLNEGTPPEEIAVIVRYNRDVEYLATLLRSHKINVNPSADSDILSHPVTRAVENLLAATLQLDDESALFDCLLGSWWGLTTSDTARLFAARTGHWPLYKLISNPDKLTDLGLDEPAKILRIDEVLRAGREQATDTVPHLVLHYLLQESGLLDHLIKTDPLENGRVLRRLYDDIEAMVVTNQATTLGAVVQQLAQRRLHNLPLLAPFIGQAAAVNVMTAHKSKGLEFDTVITPYVTDRSFGKIVTRDYFKLPLLTHTTIDELSGEDDEKRLLYVAMTRAKNNLLISSSKTDREGKLDDPSRFLTDLTEEKLPLINTDDLEANFVPEAIFATNPTPLLVDAALLRELFLARGLSVTHLNNYLEDPLKYYYENLLRKPHPRGLALLRGEAVHDVLERAVSEKKQSGNLPSASELSDWLHQSLEKLPLGKSDSVNIHETILPHLVNYLSILARQVDEKSQNELSVNVILETHDPDLPEIPLTGKLDRVDRGDDNSIIRVVDYKTGKPKSRNDIEGKTKNSLGHYKRQLVFYALLLQLDRPDIDLGQVEFCLSFVEPKNSGEVVEHFFNITQAEVDELKEEVVRVAKEIVTGAFLEDN